MAMNITPISGGPPMSPARDMAYQFVEVTAAGAMLLTLEQLRDEDKTLIDQIPDGLSEVQRCVESLGTAITKFVGPAKAENVTAALVASGYLTCHPRARFLVEAAIGRALLSFGCHALRSVTVAGFIPPQQCKLEFAALAGAMLKDPAAFDARTKSLDLAQLECRVNELQRENEKLRRAVQYNKQKLESVHVSAEGQTTGSTES